MADGTAGTSVEVRPLSGHTGAEIGGVDLSKPQGDHAIAEIRSALLKWKVVFFRGQRIGHAEQIAFAKRFGHVTYAHPHEDQPLEGFPEILPIDRRRYDSKYGRRYSYENRWHTDVTAAVNPPAASILRAAVVPAYGGDTTWTNLVAAYEGLSPAVRALVDDLRAEHRFGLGFSAQDQNNGYLKHVRNNPLVAIHPVVRVHPETGERAIFVALGSRATSSASRAWRAAGSSISCSRRSRAPSTRYASTGRTGASRSGTTAPRRTSARRT